MKTGFLLFVLCLGGAAVASAQNIGSSIGSGRPQMIVIQDDAQHASQVPMAMEHDLREQGGSSWAQGERPLWEVMPEVPRIPLGDVAREFKKEHEAVRKAPFVWVN